MARKKKRNLQQNSSKQLTVLTQFHTGSARTCDRPAGVVREKGLRGSGAREGAGTADAGGEKRGPGFQKSCCSVFSKKETQRGEESQGRHYTILRHEPARGTFPSLYWRWVGSMTSQRKEGKSLGGEERFPSRDGTRPEKAARKKKSSSGDYSHLASR